MDTVFLRGIKVIARHGVLDLEKAIPQPFEIDLAVHGDFREAGQTDALDKAVDYSTLGSLAVEIATSRSFNLIEALAEAIAQVILSLSGVAEVEVTVRKMKAPVAFELDHAGVTMRRTLG